MTNLTFLGIENPLGVIGPKAKGIIDSADKLGPLRNISENKSDYMKSAVTHETNKYINRAKALPDGVGELMVEDTLNNRNYVVKLLKKNHYPDVRISMASSFTSMLKYLSKYINDNPDCKFDTMIIYGHGAPGSINMGLGKIGIGAPKSYGKDGYEGRKNMRELFGLDKASNGEAAETRRVRDLGMKNLDVWSKAFAEIEDHVDCYEDTGRFHLFLMGCSVGGETKKRHGANSLQLAAARRLGAMINQGVCVAAPESAITDDHLDDLLNRLNEIRKACAKEDNVLLGNGKDTVKLNIAND